jgi:hypothetical protein
VVALPADACGCRFGARLEAELGEHSADVVFDRLDAEEQPAGDLAVCESGGQQFEDFFLSFGQCRVASWAGARSSSQSADEFGCPVGVSSCSEAVEGGECELRFANGDLGACLRERVGELEAGTRCLVRQLEGREQLERPRELGGPVGACGLLRTPGGERRLGLQRCLARLARKLGERVRGLLGTGGLALCNVRVDKQRQEWSGEQRFGTDLLQPPFERRGSEGRLAVEQPETDGGA